eukprot:1204540-Rhodomonas_salina.3
MRPFLETVSDRNACVHSSLQYQHTEPVYPRRHSDMPYQHSSAVLEPTAYSQQPLSGITECSIDSA